MVKTTAQKLGLGYHQVRAWFKDKVGDALVDVSLRDDRGRTPCELAEYSGHHECAKILTERVHAESLLHLFHEIHTSTTTLVFRIGTEIVFDFK